jgi:Rod binding domain-containing protein
MAGGVLKGFGIPLIVLGIVLMVAGIAAAAYGYNSQQENHDRLLRDGDQEDQAEALMVGGGVGFAAGLVVLIVGVILNAAGNGRRHRELLQATAGRAQATTATTTAAVPAAATAAAAAPASPAPSPKAAASGTPGSKKGVAIALACLGVAAVVFLALVMGKDGSAVGFGGHEEPAFAAQDYDGTVRQAFSLPVAGSATADTAGSQQEFDAPAGAHSLHIEVTWDRADAGADTLKVIVEKDGTELGRSTGGSPVVLDLPVDGGTHLRYRVFPDGNAAVAEQPFHVHVTFA